MQQYFKTGKTIVIDDQYNEAKPLLDALCRNQIPFYYTQGKPNSDFPLPNTEEKDSQYYNLIFLDLNLDFKFAGGKIGTESEEKTFKSTHAQLLNILLKNKNRSFIIVIWSNEEENYREEFLKIFDSNETYSTQKKPYKIISLSKQDFFENDSGDYKFIPDKEEELKERINLQLTNLEAFQLFCEWDRVVSQSVSDAIDDFMGLINQFNLDEEREEYLAKIITAIGIAYSGDEGFLKLTTNEQRTDSVLLALTQILNDDIDRNVLLERQQEFGTWKVKNRDEIKKLKSSIDKGLLNRKLLVFKPNRKDITGSSYKVTHDKSFFQTAFLESFDISALSKDFIKFYKKEHSGLTNEFIEKIQKKYSLSLLLKITIPVEINITPLCDIVQDKLIVHRLIKGLLIPSECFDKLSKSDYFIKTPSFSIFQKDFFLGLDLRTLFSCSKEDIEKKIIYLR